MDNNLLIIFTRNPELGKVKTRLAAKVGTISALKIYKFLLKHTLNITKDLAHKKQVHYSIKVRDNDIWNDTIYTKKQQFGEDLGSRMNYAIQQGFADKYQNIIIIGSDMYDLSQQDIDDAFRVLLDNDFVVGPAEDGGYYLLGMKRLKTSLFQNKNWGSSSVFSDTMKDLKNEKVYLLPIKNDIDYYEDIKNIAVFEPFIKEKNSL